MLKPTQSDLDRHIEILRGGVRTVTATLQKLRSQQDVDLEAVLRHLASIRAGAEEVRVTLAKSPHYPVALPRLECRARHHIATA